jgi:hypothetical protein
MKLTRSLFLSVLILAASTASVWAQTMTASNTSPSTPAAAAPAATPAATPAQPPITAADIQALKDAIAAQQLQIQALQEQLQQRQNPNAQQLQVQPAAPPQPAPQQVAALNESSSSVQPAQQDPNQGTGMMMQDPNAKDENPMHGGTTIHFRGINITPGGFAEAAFVRRSRGLAADLTTPFNSITMPGAAQSDLSEFFGSARQSRPTVYVDGRLSNVQLSSYVSGDFLSAGVTSTATQTNSYTFRLRQAWGQAKFDNGWSFLGGQAWSLVTENKAGIAPSDDTGRTNDARPMTIDPGYNVGFTFARQYGIRLTKSFGDKVAIAFAMENAQATLTSHGNAGNFVLGEAGASNTYNIDSNYSFNPSPDLIAKIAFDPGFGHYEVFGLFDRFRDRVYPCEENFAGCGLAASSVQGAYNASANGGGVGANARWNFANKHIVFGLHGFGGSGVGRYGAAQLSDIAINADGTVHPIKDLQGLATLEWHGKKLDVYAYTGAEYAARTYSYDPNTGKFVGYAAPTLNNTGCYTETLPGASGNNGTAGFEPGALANCTADTRAIIEGTAGFWYRFYQGSRGKFQFGAQYSYVTRGAWSGDGGVTPGAPIPEPHGIDNMVFTSFRYYLP